MPWPSTGKRRPKYKITLRKVLTKDERQQLLSYLKANTKTVDGQRRYAIIHLFLNSGLRATELANLRVENTPLVLGCNAIEVVGKGNKVRTITIAAALAIKLKTYVEKTRPKNLPRHVRRKDYTKPVFYSQRKRPYLKKVNTDAGVKLKASDGLYQLVVRAGLAAGLEKHLHPHILRHTYATNAIENSQKIRRLQDNMGHSDLTTTAKYAHFVEHQDDRFPEDIYIDG